MRCKWQMCTTKAIGANSYYKSCHQLPTSWRTHAMRAGGLARMRVLEEILSPSSSPKIGVKHMRAPCPRSECQDGTKGQRGSASKDSFRAWAGVQQHCRPWMNLQCRQQAPIGQRNVLCQVRNRTLQADDLQEERCQERAEEPKPAAGNAAEEIGCHAGQLQRGKWVQWGGKGRPSASPGANERPLREGCSA